MDQSAKTINTKTENKNCPGCRYFIQRIAFWEKYLEKKEKSQLIAETISKQIFHVSNLEYP